MKGLHQFEHILMYKHIQMVQTQILTTYLILTMYNNVQLSVNYFKK